MHFLKKIKRLRKFWLEIILIVLATITSLVSAFLYFRSVDEDQKQQKIKETIATQSEEKPANIYVDVSGAVKKPGLYEALNGQRLESLIEKAGGLTETADKDFFARNFNLSSELFDQQKIYIPTVWEVTSGYFIDKTGQVAGTSTNNNGQASDDLIDLNKATLEELDTLPGVGPVTAQKIIDNRPYGALQELIDKKVFGKNAFEKVKDLIGI